MKHAPADEDETRVRIDKWLWAARFFKTRALASDAVDGGKVQVNGQRVKPAKAVNVGDVLNIRRERFEFVVTVLALSTRRGPAPEAARLYSESAESRAAREELALLLKAENAALGERKGRPTKRDRRHITRFVES